MDKISAFSREGGTFNVDELFCYLQPKFIGPMHFRLDTKRISPFNVKRTATQKHGIIKRLCDTREASRKSAADAVFQNLPALIVQKNLCKELWMAK